MGLSHRSQKSGIDRWWGDLQLKIIDVNVVFKYVMYGKTK